MYDKTILGSYEDPIQGVIGDKARTVFFTPSRGAFLVLVRLNVFGLADLLNIPNDPRMSAAKRASAKSLVDSFYTKWHDKFGGNRTELASVIAKGAAKRAFGFNIPLVQNLGFVKKLKAAGAIGNLSSNQIGIGIDPATDAVASTGTALPILVEIGGILTSLVTLILAFKKPNDPMPGTGTGSGSGTNDSLPPPPPTEDTAGYGWIGLAALAAIYIGTTSKTPVKRRRTVKK